MLRLHVKFFKGFVKKSRFAECLRMCSSTIGPPDLDIAYQCDEANMSEIANNIQHRKSRADLNKVLTLSKKIKELQFNEEQNGNSLQELKEALTMEMSKIPNKTHPDVLKYREHKPHIIRTGGKQIDFEFTPKQFLELAENMDVLRTKYLGNITGSRSYYLKGVLADLEYALVRYTLKHLLKRGFQLISVPDLIIPDIIEGCGMATTGQRTQVFQTVSPWKERFCLAGTAEMPLAGLYIKRTFTRDELPLRVCAVSRCYRAETSKLEEENYGIFRVREFTKVEMFGITSNEMGEESGNMLSEFVKIQEELFSEIGLHYFVLDMPPNELGASAYRKFDIEAWMPGRKLPGEISSASNCTDYQSRRLHIKYESEKAIGKHVHTVNGTACAVPRMIIAIFENYQTSDGSVVIPHVLRPYMEGKSVIKNTGKEHAERMSRSSFHK